MRHILSISSSLLVRVRPGLHVSPILSISSEELMLRMGFTCKPGLTPTSSEELMLRMGPTHKLGLTLTSCDELVLMLGLTRKILSTILHLPASNPLGIVRTSIFYLLNSILKNP